jgi:hypothetical protein
VLKTRARNPQETLVINVFNIPKMPSLPRWPAIAKTPTVSQAQYDALWAVTLLLLTTLARTQDDPAAFLASVNETIPGDNDRSRAARVDLNIIVSQAAAFLAPKQ